MNSNIRFFSKRLIYRSIKESDSEQIVNWRSDRDTIKYFINPVPITLEQHNEWFKKYLVDSTRYDFLVVIKEINVPIGLAGVSNISPENSSCHINYAICDKNYRNKGLAVEAVYTLIEYFRSNLCINKFIAVIHKENLASITVVKKLGFNLEYTESNFLYYTKNIYHRGLYADNLYQS